MSKLSFNGSTKTITVLPGVPSLDIRNDVWTEWVAWQELNPNWEIAMRYSGLDPIPGGESGGIFFLINNWKLIIDFTQTAVFGVLYSDNYNTAYWNSSGQAQFPAMVSALVNTVNIGSTQVITVPADPNDVRDAVWNADMDTVASVPGSIGEYIRKRILTVAKFLGLK